MQTDEQDASSLGHSKPILAGQPLDLGKLTLVVGDDAESHGNGLRCNQQIVAADWTAELLKPGAQQTVGSIGRRFERPYIDSAEHRFELGREPRRPLLSGAIA